MIPKLGRLEEFFNLEMKQFWDIVSNEGKRLKTFLCLLKKKKKKETTYEKFVKTS